MKALLCWLFGHVWLFGCKERLEGGVVVHQHLGTFCKRCLINEEDT